MMYRGYELRCERGHVVIYDGDKVVGHAQSLTEAVQDIDEEED